MILGTAAVAAAAAAPWAFGCTDPVWASALAAVCLVLASADLLRDLFDGSRRDPVPRALLAGACLLPLPALAGLLPVPAWLHALLVPAGASLLDAAGDAASWRTLSLRSRSSLEAATLAGAYAGTFLVVLRAARRPGFRAAAATAMCLAGAALAVFGLVQDARQTDPPTIYGTVAIYEVATPFGPYVNRNHFAGAMEVLAGIAAGELLSAACGGRRIAAALFGLCLAAVLAALVATTSRGAVVGAAAGAALLAASVPHARRTRLLLAAGGGAVLVLAAAKATGWFDGVLQGLLRVNPRWSHRFSVQADALLAFVRNPIVGTGAGTFEDVYPAFQRVRDLRSFGNAHSDAAQFLMETGLAGAAVAADLARRLVRCLRDGLARAGPERWRILGPAAGAVALGAHGLLDVNLHVPANALLTAVALSLACAAALGPPGPGDAADAPGPVPVPEAPAR